MDAQNSTRQLPDGTVLEITAEQLAEARGKADGIVEAKDFDKVIFRSCWICNPAHLRLAEADGILLRCFGCGRFFIDGVDITNYEPAEEENASADTDEQEDEKHG